MPPTATCPPHAPARGRRSPRLHTEAGGRVCFAEQVTPSRHHTHGALVAHVTTGMHQGSRRTKPPPAQQRCLGCSACADMKPYQRPVTTLLPCVQAHVTLLHLGPPFGTTDRPVGRPGASRTALQAAPEPGASSWLAAPTGNEMPAATWSPQHLRPGGSAALLPAPPPNQMSCAWLLPTLADRSQHARNLAAHIKAAVSTTGCMPGAR